MFCPVGKMNWGNKRGRAMNGSWGREGSPVLSITVLSLRQLLLVEHDATVQVQAQTRLDLIHKQGCQHQVPVWPPSSSHAAPLLTSNKSLMGDRDLLGSKWDTINAPVFLINDVRYENRDKLTLLAAVRACVRAGRRVCARQRWPEMERGRQG